MARRERRLRSMVRAGLPVAGTLVIFGAILFVDDLVVQVAVVLLGILLIQAGVWRLAEPLLPEARTNLALRNEVDGFLELIREMDSAQRHSEPGAPSDAEELRDQLHARVERMYSASGRADGAERDSAKAESNTGSSSD